LALRLEAAGVDAASVTDVVLTHMHMDHIGGLLGDGLGSWLRPDLRVHVAAAEAEFWESPDFSHTNMPEGVREWLAELSSEDPSGAHAVEVATRGSNLRRR
jgi:glyoxylase-like metal-dependent hydrolase (beta-lactamase superfamily II)